VFEVGFADDLLLSTDTLLFLTAEEMVDGLEFDVYNFTSGDLEITEMENEGMTSFHWYIDPWTLSLPYTMSFADTLTFNVKIDLPVSYIAGELLVDTLEILTTNGISQVFIKVDPDLLTGLEGESKLSSVRLSNIFPNPASELVTIEFHFDESTHASVEVYTMDGRRVAILADRILAVGSHEIIWNLKENGQQVPAGIYVVRLRTNEGSISRKLVITN
jgi:hypothetical protein